MEDSITKKDDFPCMTQGWKVIVVLCRAFPVLALVLWFFALTLGFSLHNL
jgi:hypothetical protein